MKKKLEPITSAQIKERQRKIKTNMAIDTVVKNEILIADTKKQEDSANMFKRKLQEIMSIPMTPGMKKRYEDFGITCVDGDIADAIAGALAIQAMNGNIAAYTTIRDTMGYKPVEQTRNDVVVRIDMSAKARELGE